MASYSLALIVLIAFPILTLVFFKTVDDFFIILTSFVCAMTIVHLITLTHLTSKLRKIGILCLKDAIRSINI